MLLLLAFLSVFPVATAAISQANAAADPVGACWSAPLPDGVEPHDNTLRTVSVTQMPVGLRCDWEAADVQTGWPVTIAALAGTVVCVGATIFALRQRGGAHRFVSLLPLISIAIMWIAIWMNRLQVIID